MDIEDFLNEPTEPIPPTEAEIAAYRRGVRAGQSRSWCLEAALRYPADNTQGQSTEVAIARATAFENYFLTCS